MAIRMRRGNEADLDLTKLVSGEIAVSEDAEKVRVSLGNGEAIDLATKKDLDNLITYEGIVSVVGETLTFTPKE